MNLGEGIDQRSLTEPVDSLPRGARREPNVDAPPPLPQHKRQTQPVALLTAISSFPETDSGDYSNEITQGDSDGDLDALVLQEEKVSMLMGRVETIGKRMHTILEEMIRAVFDSEEEQKLLRRLDGYSDDLKRIVQQQNKLFRVGDDRSRTLAEEKLKGLWSEMREHRTTLIMITKGAAQLSLPEIEALVLDSLDDYSALLRPYAF